MRSNHSHITYNATVKQDPFLFSSSKACHVFFLLSLSPKTSLFLSKPSSLLELFITFNGATARSNQYDLNALLHLTDSIVYCIFSIHATNLQQHSIIRKLVLMTVLILLIILVPKSAAILGNTF